MCDNYVVLLDNEAHTCCLPDVETLNVGAIVQCTAPRLQGGEMKPCNFKYYVDETFWRKRKRYTELVYNYFI